MGSCTPTSLCRFLDGFKVIGVGSRVKTNDGSYIAAVQGRYGTVVSFRKDFGQYGRLWKVKWTDEDTGGQGEYELDCYENRLVEYGVQEKNQYINTTPTELNNLEDKVISTVRGMISNYRLTKNQVADWLSELSNKVKRL